MAKKALKDGSALEKFKDLIKGQGGDAPLLKIIPKLN